MINSKNSYAFEAPVVPIADPIDGLLQTVDLTRKIEVNITLWDAVREGVYIQLLIDGNLTGGAYTVTDSDRAGDRITIELVEGVFEKDGIYALSFQATNPISLVSNQSPHTYLKAHRVAPGAALIAPVIFATANFGDSLSGRIPGYSGMAIGDVARMLCNDTAGPSIQVSAEHFESPIMIQIERSFLTSLGSAEVIVEYLITDRAGNTSAKSHPVSVTLQI